MIPKTILVIDNNPVILTLTERLLARLGHEVITASSGIGALQILKQSIPDIILLDLVMPDISGDRLCRLIRENSRFRATRIVIVTAMASEERIPFLEMGADACIAKAPFNRLSESIMGAIEHLDRSAEPIPEVIGLEHVQSRIIVRELNSIRNSLETVISSISEGVFELDPSGVIRNVNRAAVSISEKEERELPGLNFVELFNDSDTKKILGLFQEAGEAPTQPAEFEIPSGRKLSLQVFRFAGEDEKLLVLATDVTGFESELEESRKRYLEITELLPQMVFETDQSGCITYINLNAASFLGIDNSQSLSGQNLFEYIDAGDQERSRRDFQRIIAGERISGVEYTAVNRKGKRIPLLVYSAPILENDLPVGVRAVAADITERKKYEDDLRISEEKYRGILESIDDGYFELDLRGNLVFANPALPRMWGYRFEDLYGRNYRNYMDEESARNIWLKFNDVFKTGRPERILDGKFFRKDGSISYFQTSVGLILDSGKEPIGFRGIIRDVSERKLAEEALRCAEANYRNIFENAVEGIFQTSPEGRFISANPAMVRLLGYDSPGEVLSSIRDISAQVYADASHRREYMRQIQQRGFVQNFETQFRRRDGALIWVSINARAVRGSRGEVLHYEGTAQDITDRKRLEAQLLQAQKMEAIGTLAGGIAHDFNNLLMGIQGYTSLMLYDMEPGHPHHAKLKSIEEQVKSGAALAKQMLGFARAGKYEVKPTDLRETADKSAAMFGRTRKELTIHKKFAPDLWTVEADRGQIEQVLLNLFVNAWQAMPAGGDLFICLENTVLEESYTRAFHAEPGRYVKLSVTDTGTGMDERTLERIFEPFFTTKEMGRGTGLGLATAYGIITGHGGIINVYSEKGHGTTFNVYLPASGKPLRPEEKPPEEVLRGSGTILLVDDEETIVKVKKELLEKLGYSIVAAASGREALEIYRARGGEIDLVIMDMIMPEMGGEELFEHLKTIDPQVKVILSSGYSLNGQAVRILERGCRAFIQKPFSMAEISAKIREVLGS